MNIRRMSLEELEMVLDWANDEGWNPGLSDAEAFYSADPNGFFLAEVDQEPEAAISVINHDENHAFLGLYICREKFRGRGHGFALWAEALKHAEGRSVTLEGVPEQQQNYVRSGFKSMGETVRYLGTAKAEHAHVELAKSSDIPFLMQADEKVVGHQRNAFAQTWFASTPNRKTMIIREGNEPTAYATFRRCGHGIKIGPFSAATEVDAKRLLAGNPFEQSNEVSIDVPAGSSELTSLVKAMAFKPVFKTARMVRGEEAPGELPAYSAVATLELG